LDIVLKVHRNRSYFLIKYILGMYFINNLMGGVFSVLKILPYAS
jgi:hypothetical protein